MANEVVNQERAILLLSNVDTDAVLALINNVMVKVDFTELTPVGAERNPAVPGYWLVEQQSNAAGEPSPETLAVIAQARFGEGRVQTFIKGTVFHKEAGGLITSP